MRLLIALLVLVASSFAQGQSCTVLYYGVAGADTTAIVKTDSTVFTCADPEQALSISRNSTRKDSVISRLNSLVSTQNKTIQELDSSYLYMVRVDTTMQRQSDSLRRVITLSDSIRTKVADIRAFQEGQLTRCQEGRMTFMEKLTIGVGLFLMGGIAGAAAAF